MSIKRSLGGYRCETRLDLRLSEGRYASPSTRWIVFRGTHNSYCLQLRAPIFFYRHLSPPGQKGQLFLCHLIQFSKTENGEAPPQRSQEKWREDKKKRRMTGKESRTSWKSWKSSRILSHDVYTDWLSVLSSKRYSLRQDYEISAMKNEDVSGWDYGVVACHQETLHLFRGNIFEKKKNCHEPSNTPSLPLILLRL